MRRMAPVTPSRTTAVALALLLVGLLSLSPLPTQAAGAALRISPTSGTYEVGSTVDVAFLVDTGGESINAVQADISFPPDKLQVVNPVASTSFISLWVTTPTYSNTDGTVHFQGGLPNPGIKTSAGVISTVTFRVKAPGTARLKFLPTSRVLKNDGEGTDILTSTGTAEFILKVPPPAGPATTSPTHPDADRWYNNPSVQFQWEGVDGAAGYSFVFDQSPKTVPDETADTTANAASVTATGDGVWYFHIRAKTVTWGGVTTVPVQIDATAPATFTPRFERDPLTVEEAPILSFLTSDAASGIDHYEVKSLVVTNTETGQNTLFVEASSPYTLGKLPAGKYRFIVRAIDRAGNAVEGTADLTVVAGGLPFFARVPFLRNPAVANGVLIGLGLLALILIIVTLLRKFRLGATFRKDLHALERDAQHKASQLQEELAELSEAQSHSPPVMPEKLPPPPDGTIPPTPPTPPNPPPIPPVAAP